MAKDAGGADLHERTIPKGKTKSIAHILDTMQTAIEAAAGGAGSVLADGDILVGNVSNVAAAVTMSGDATIVKTGAITIAAGAVDEAMLVIPSGDGLHAKRIARATYNFAVDGGAISSIGLGVTLPDNAIVTRTYIQVITTLESSTDAATIALTIPTDDVAGLRAAVAISSGTSWDAGFKDGIQDGVIANFSEQCTAEREITVTIAEEAVTAGKFIVFCEYIVSD